MLLPFIIVLISVLAYTWLLYPALMLWSGRRGRGWAEAREFRPCVTVLFSAHNEEAVIRRRLENLAALDYPVDRINVVVGVDGGSDRTAEIAKEWAYSHPNVTVVVSVENRGKMAMLRELVASTLKPPVIHPPPSTLHPEPFPPALLVFTDANTMFDREAMARLVQPFRDASVGGVCGRLLFHARSGGSTDEPSYWDIETRLKDAESRIDSCLGANGAIYAIRGGLFPRDIPDNVIIDDFVIGMKVREQGHRMVFAGEALAREDLPHTVAEEWRRRVRIGAGAYQALCLCRRCLRPRFGAFAWMFWSHKVLRWLTPHMLLAVMCLGVAVAMRRLMVHGQWLMVNGVIASVCGLALVCLLSRRVGARSGPLRLLAYFFTIQAALFAGFIRFCRGGLSGAWKRTERRL